MMKPDIHLQHYHGVWLLLHDLLHHLPIQQLLLFPSFLLLMALPLACNANDFVECMITTVSSSSSSSSTFNYLHSRGSPSYTHLLDSAQQNPRWLNATPLPLFIITPYTSAGIQAAITCSRRHHFLIRVKSGGHDYEGLSFANRCNTQSPHHHFVILDLLHFRSINIHFKDDETAAYAWVQSGATLGELYYNIAHESKVHGFPAGLCPSVGVGGHFSGGGFGTLLRKHGLAADNILDAHLMDVNGNIMNRASMGEDLFWAIRGGGGTSFGVILAWKIKLVPVPPVVTVFTIHKNLQDHETIRLIHKWQHVSSSTKLPNDLFIRVVIQRINGGITEALFNSLFLGPVDHLIPLMNKSFPELGVHSLEKACTEMSWIESVLYFAGFDRGSPLEVLLNTTVQYKSSFKAKSDFVERPIPETGLQGIKERLLAEENEEEGSAAFVIMDSFGGRMEEIPPWELPFPHRGGNLFNVQYLVKWMGEAETSSRKHLKWMKELYKYMKPYVSNSPRAAYINYRDLDLGINPSPPCSQSDTSPSLYKGMNWGRKYFKGNLERLMQVKKQVDPGNFFRNEQSIPLPL